MDKVQCVVVGAGVVGLATARALALQGLEVMVLEAGAGIGTGTSSRNSEVIHAGLYYPQGSLKARLCVSGRQMMYRYCQERSVPHRQCGKLIVATSAEQLPALQAVIEKGTANGVSGLTLLDEPAARELEPALRCVAAVHSPETGILDSHAFMLSLQGDLENAGGMVVFNSPLQRAVCRPHAFVLQTADGTELEAEYVINSAGLSAPDLARKFAGLPSELVPTAYYAKGNYFTLAGRSPFERLIYPVPEAAGLGVHLTIDLGGQAKFGPDVQWVDSADDLVVDPDRARGFYAEVRKYWPELQDGALIPGYAGIRPKIQSPTEVARDFLIQGPATHGVSGLVNLFGIESPGLTSSLAIAQHVASELGIH